VAAGKVGRQAERRKRWPRAGPNILSYRSSADYSQASSTKLGDRARCVRQRRLTIGCEGNPGRGVSGQACSPHVSAMKLRRSIEQFAAGMAVTRISAAHVNRSGKTPRHAILRPSWTGDPGEIPGLQTRHAEHSSARRGYRLAGAVAASAWCEPRCRTEVAHHGDEHRDDGQHSSQSVVNPVDSSGSLIRMCSWCSVSHLSCPVPSY